MKVILILAACFLLVTAGLAVLFLPDAREIALRSWRKSSGWVSRLLSATQLAGQQRVHQASTGSLQTLRFIKNWVVHYAAGLAVATVVLIVVPLLAMAWRHWYALDTYENTDARIQDPRIAALLAGERLVPPAPLPPDVFTTREVQLVRPMARFASRNWELLDPEFSQRLLMVFKIMREKHGYEMVLIEGYRSPQRQDQLASFGDHVTKVGAFRSYHQFGLAADSAFLKDGKVVISEKDPWAMRGYEFYGEVAASLGMTWGGGWRSIKDLGHVELRRPGVLRRAN